MFRNLCLVATSNEQMQAQEYKRKKTLMSASSYVGKGYENWENPGKNFENIKVNMTKEQVIYVISTLFENQSYHFSIRIISGWQIIRASEKGSDEFVMIYDIVVEQAEPEEEVEENKKEYGKAVTSQYTSLSDQKTKDVDEVFEE